MKQACVGGSHHIAGRGKVGEVMTEHNPWLSWVFLGFPWFVLVFGIFIAVHSMLELIDIPILNFRTSCFPQLDVESRILDLGSRTSFFWRKVLLATLE